MLLVYFLFSLKLFSIGKLCTIHNLLFTLRLLKLNQLFLVEDYIEFLACLIKRLTKFDIHVACKSGAKDQNYPQETILVIVCKFKPAVFLIVISFRFLIINSDHLLAHYEDYKDDEEYNV